MLPFAGIAFLWFIAVVRDRLGELEDRFFATVFLGSGLLFIAMVFIAAALAGGILRVLASGSEYLIQSGAYTLGRAEIFQTMHISAMKIAGVFMMVTSTISLQTRALPRWMALFGYLLALALLLSIGTIQWIPLVFPLWILLCGFLDQVFDPRCERGDWADMASNNARMTRRDPLLSRGRAYGPACRRFSRPDA